MHKPSRPMVFMLAFAALNLAWRLCFLPVSQGSYSDGILQVDTFRQGLSFWPPFFALVTRLVAVLPGLGLEGAGRLVALLCGVLLLFPLAALARRLFGLRAAFWAMVVWTASPMALRWSLQNMTDMPMAALWTASLAALLLGVELYRPSLFPPATAPAAPQARAANQWLLIASLCGALATLTRYQGIFLFPLNLLAAWQLARLARRLPNRAYSPWLTLLPWLAVPCWLLQGLGSLARHGQQIGARMSPLGFWDTFIQVYWFMFEEFLLKTPYFVTYGLFSFFLYGLFRTQWATVRLRWFGWVCLYLTLAILILQSVFSAYQSRYLLPLLPLVCLLAGHGLATWERHCERRPLRFWGLVLPALAWGLIFSALVAVWQGTPFMDVKNAARFVRDRNLPELAQIFSNEHYGDMGSVKISFWSGGRTVLPLNPAMRIKPGDLVVLSSFDAGSFENYTQLKAQLLQALPARPIHEPFSRVAWPLLPDLMQETYTHTNPLAWSLRYRRQYFETSVLEVLGTASTDSPESPSATPHELIPPLKDDARAKLINDLKSLQKVLPAKK